MLYCFIPAPGFDFGNMKLEFKVLNVVAILNFQEFKFLKACIKSESTIALPACGCCW